MTKPTNPALIGAFVIGALTLIVIGVVLFGGGGLFTAKRHYVAFFSGSVYGLSIGAPVTFRGVRIGSVTDVSAILLIPDERPNIKIQVTLEIKRQPLKSAGSDFRLDRLSDEEVLDLLVNGKGLRAVLAMQSIVTGQLYIDMDFFPGTEAVIADLDTIYPQIPTRRSGLQKLAQSLQSLPFEKMADEAIAVLDGINRIIASGELDDILEGADLTVVQIRQFVQRLNQRFDPLVDILMNTAEQARGALAQAEGTLALEDGVPGELAARLNKALGEAVAALAQARVALTLEQGVPGRLANSLIGAADMTKGAMGQGDDTLTAVKGLVSERSPLMLRMVRLLDELSAAARSLRVMADYLQRHPEALLRGKRR